MIVDRLRVELPVSAAHAAPNAVLHGELHLPDLARGIVLFVDACGSEARASDGAVAEALQAHRFGSVAIDLLNNNECHFADAENHLPLLAERLLAVIGRLHRLMESEAIATLPLGLAAAGPATPLAVRAAALRDKDVGAVVGHGGLVDIAGLQYLKALQAPLLLLVDADDAVAERNLLRARPYLNGISACERLPAPPADAAAAAAEATVRWFERYLVA